MSSSLFLFLSKICSIFIFFTPFLCQIGVTYRSGLAPAFFILSRFLSFFYAKTILCIPVLSAPKLMGIHLFLFLYLQEIYLHVFGFRKGSMTKKNFSRVRVFLIRLTVSIKSSQRITYSLFSLKVSCAYPFDFA